MTKLINQSCWLNRKYAGKTYKEKVVCAQKYILDLATGT